MGGTRIGAGGPQNRISGAGRHVDRSWWHAGRSWGPRDPVRGSERSGTLIRLIARASDLGRSRTPHGCLTAWVARQPTQRAPQPHRGRRAETESVGERRGPTQEAPRSDTNSERVAGRDTECAGARHRECGRAPEPDTDSAEHRHRERRGPTQKARDCRNPTQREPGPDTESGGRAPGRDPD